MQFAGQSNLQENLASADGGSEPDITGKIVIAEEGGNL